MDLKNRIIEQNRIVPLLVGLFAILFLLGYLYPDPWWGVHFISFVPGFLQFVLVFTAGLLLLNGIVGKNKYLPTIGKSDIPGGKLVVYAIGIITAILFYNLPIAGDFYGNSRGFQSVLDTKVQTLPADFFSNLFSFEFVPGNGRGGVKLIVELISLSFNVTIHEAFKILDALCGGLFVIVWLLAVRHFIKVRSWQIIAAVTGLTSPFLLIYFGHVETYAPIYLILLSWLLIFVLFIRKRQARLYWTLAVLLLVGVRLHTLMYLLVPAFLVATAFRFNIIVFLQQKAANLKSTFVWMYLPLFLGGLFLYFFVFEDYDDPRRLTDFEDIDRLFLPMVSPPPPLDNYNMFSMSHLLDFFNAILLWSPVLLFLFGYLIAAKRKLLNWNLPEVNLLVLTFLLFSTILFTMNPLFSMPMDWDLFCFPVPVLLVLLLLLIEQIEKEPLGTRIVSTSAGLALLCLPAFVVLLSTESNSYRTERLGVHIYKTYYEHSSTYLLMSLNMLEGDELYKERKLALIEELEEYALPGNDKQYAELLIDQAYFDLYRDNNPTTARKNLLKSMEYLRLPDEFEKLAYDINVTLIRKGYKFTDLDKAKATEIVENAIILLREKKEYENALREFRYSRYYDPLSGRAIMFSVEALFRMQRFGEAYNYALDLVALKYPDHKTALRIGIHTALEAGKYQKALDFCNEFLEYFENEEPIETVKKRLEANDKVEELKFLFNRG